jgi:predicted PurR-regulated permease PerM
MKKIGFLVLFAMFLACSVMAVQTAKVITAPKTTDTVTQVVSQNQSQSALESKLSPDQLFELEKIKAGVRSEDSSPLGSAGIVIVSTMPFLTAILIVFFVMYAKRKKEQRLVDLYEKAIESGRDLPPEFFKRPEEDQKSYLLKGMIWFGVGIGITIGGLILMGYNSPWAFGLIPALVGIAYGISYFVEKKGKSNVTNNE